MARAVWSRCRAVLDEAEQRDRVLEDCQALEPDLTAELDHLDAVLGDLTAARSDDRQVLDADVDRAADRESRAAPA